MSDQSTRVVVSFADWDWTKAGLAYGKAAYFNGESLVNDPRWADHARAWETYYDLAEAEGQLNTNILGGLKGMDSPPVHCERSRPRR